MISFYMKGDALSWFKWMHFNHQLQDWESFTRSLELRFGPSSYENHQQMLFKLRQQGSVIDYLLTLYYIVSSLDYYLQFKRN
uniref:Retrotransposon gag domain-containing protein n=1 Tax=Cajanus cajan TaxID=3821 RepID=A0A151QM49_CAJCA|nr:hypothetical protein KK1_048338 [Cajanus cajan]